MVLAAANNKGGSNNQGSFGQGGFNNKGGQGGFNNQGSSNTKGVSSSVAVASAAATTAAASVASVSVVSSAAAAANTGSVLASTGSNNAGSAASNNTGSSASNSADAQTSLTLDPAVIATGFENDGQSPPVAGQVASATSSNNFINFCLTTNLPITNGQQIVTGSCNPAPMGVIAAQAKMPSTKFTFPPNGGTVKSNTAFTFSTAVRQFTTGNFVNANANYFAAPQTVDGSGFIVGHSHITVQSLDSLDQTTAQDPTIFAFFKGLNDKAQNGILSADVTSGLPAGVYKASTIMSAANHQPCLVAVAQHGSLDDAIYFFVTDDGQPPANGFAGQGAAAAGASNSTAAAANTATAAVSVAAAASSTAAAADVSASAASVTVSASAASATVSAAAAKGSAAVDATAADKGAAQSASNGKGGAFAAQNAKGDAQAQNAKNAPPAVNAQKGGKKRGVFSFL